MLFWNGVNQANVKGLAGQNLLPMQYFLSCPKYTVHMWTLRSMENSTACIDGRKERR